MEKLIEVHQENLIVCDNETCNFKIPNKSGSINTDCRQYINAACPKCGQNLLTIQDYENAEKLRKLVNRINKYFSWITIFIPKSAKSTDIRVSTHKKITYEIDPKK